MSTTCLALLSGGLDSLLALRIMVLQNIKVFAFHGVNCFHGTEDIEAKKAKLRSKALSLGAEGIIFQNTTEEVIRVTKNPHYGFGKNVNACLDCRLETIKAAFRVMPDFNASFLVSGEVLAQRPMSQRKGALKIIDKVLADLGYPGLLLRPLSAKILPVTIPEERGWVLRENLYRISGRGRKDQLSLAKKLGVTDYPDPAGGCLLTNPLFAVRMRDLMLHQPSWHERDASLVKLGRHFRLSPNCKIIVSRNERENYKLKSFATSETHFYLSSPIPGALVMVDGELSKDAEHIASGLALYYSKLRLNNIGEVQTWRGTDDSKVSLLSSQEVVEPLSIKDLYIGKYV